MSDRAGVRWAAAIGAVAALQILSWLLAPAVTLPPVLAASLVFALVAGAVILVGAVAPAFGVRALAWLLVPALLLGAVVILGRPAGDILAAILVAGSLLAGGSLVGGVIGARIEHVSHLLVVAYVSSLADLFSVFSARGVSAHVVENERLLSVLAISWPMPGSGEPMPVLGVGDVVMCALYLAAARELGLGVPRMALALAAGFAAVLAALLALRIPLPALPALGVAVVLAHPSSWRLRPGERWKAIGGMALLTLLFAALSV